MAAGYRYERKYKISARTAAILRGRISAVMRPDDHSGGVYMVNNLYLDDRGDSFLRQKYNGSLQRDKYRVRFYNDDLSFIRLERKHKEGERVCKESALLTIAQYRRIQANDLAFFTTATEPLLETVGMLHRLRGMRLAANFAYKREAYQYEPGRVRVTLDNDIGHRPAPPGEEYVLEIKYGAFLPRVIAALFDGLPLVCTDMSKYAYIREKELWRHGRSITGFDTDYPGAGKPECRDSAADLVGGGAVRIGNLSGVSVF